MKNLFRVVLSLIISLPCVAQVPQESDYYRMVRVPIPQDIMLEVGGMSFTPDGRLGVATRRGEVWLIDNPVMAGTSSPHYQRFAYGLHEPLGLAWHDGSFYTSQRSELTRLVDANGDAVADQYETVYSWPLEGNYHEYSYGPLIQKDGSMVVMLNLGWIGYGASQSKWRGWTLSIDPNGEMTPIATGMRSPAGMGMNVAGDLFYAENQGDWVGSGYITHVEMGDFVGNPAGLRWTSEEDSPLSLKPDEIPDTGQPLFEVAKEIDAFKPPAVWFPHTILGISTSDIVPDTTDGKFGPFAGQLFVGDQGHSKITRVFLEKVQGIYQGAAIPFREGFASGVLRMAWDPEGGMMVGQTSRGWGATGKEPYALERLVWTGKIPFEMHSVRAMPDGFLITLTKPADGPSAAILDNYSVESFTYKYHSNYGSPPINITTHQVKAALVSEDRLEIRLVLDGLREGYIYSINAEGLHSGNGDPLLHSTAFYTMNRLPEGASLQIEPDQTTDTAQPDLSGAQPSESEPNVRLSVGTLPNLQFSQTEFTVPAGSTIALTFNNDDDMLHNLVVVESDATDEVVMAAMQLGLRGHEMQYVPNSDAVIAHTGLLEPGISETIIFRVPDEAGQYSFVCTFPGHATTMRGIIQVVAN
ncbi:MAG: auracyanin family protein [Rhodothermaceae bacterium]|nr:auracyanin family protein [Rhodothermaceae bacterium]MXZ58200.1 auracyanin family protein [Rhodothermaceae bacterium]MYD66781.1 auracyanin family protein [Rhodothermaceae bacterium]MYH13029.1 auracyanin family protein [Rhodothermaceae bacterium]MYJ08363.1 auracyanin family protein [Rhodothermaceae bacterium]